MQTDFKMNNLLTKIQDNYLLFMLLWIAAILIFAYAWVPGGLDVDSCNYAVVAKEILRTHKWLGLYDPVSRQCRMDLPVSLFITLAILSFILAQRRTRLYYLLFGLFSCLAIFTKDVSGFAPLVIIFIYLVLRWRWKELFHPLFLLGLLVATGPVLGWIWLDLFIKTRFHLIYINPV